jgi:hypothetical protein
MALVPMFILTLHLAHRGWRWYAVVPIAGYLLAYLLFLALAVPDVITFINSPKLLMGAIAIEATAVGAQIAMHFIPAPYPPLETAEDEGEK